MKVRVEEYTQRVNNDGVTKHVDRFKIYCGPSPVMRGITRRAHADRIVARIEQALAHMGAEIERL